jgi:hypothetical protein
LAPGKQQKTNNQGERRIRLGFWLFLAILIFNFWAYNGGSITGSDGYYVYLSARSILEQGSLSINETGYVPGTETYRAKLGMDGKLYPVSGVGWIISLVPGLVLGKVIALLPLATTPEALINFFASIVMPVAGALLGFLIYASLLRLGVGRAVGIGASLLCILTTPLWHYSSTGNWGEILLCLSFFASFYLLQRYRDSSEVHWLFLSSACLACAMTVKLYALIVVAPILLYLWLILPYPPRKRPLWLIVYLLPFSLGVLVVMTTNLIHFGGVFNVGYTVSNQTRSIPPGIGIFGLLFSPGEGLLFYFPASILAVIGFFKFCRQHRAEAVLIVVSLIAFLIFFGRLWYWSGDPGYGPRYIMPMIPLLILPISHLLNRLRRIPRTIWFAIFASLGILVTLPGLLLQWRFMEHIVPAGGIRYYMPECSPIYAGWRTIILTNSAGIFTPPEIATYPNGPYRLEYPIPPQIVGSFWFSPLCPTTEVDPAIGKTMLVFGFILPLLGGLAMVMLIRQYRRTLCLPEKKFTPRSD